MGFYTTADSYNEYLQSRGKTNEYLESVRLRSYQLAHGMISAAQAPNGGLFKKIYDNPSDSPQSQGLHFETIPSTIMKRLDCWRLGGLDCGKSEPINNQIFNNKLLLLIEDN